MKKVAVYFLIIYVLIIGSCGIYSEQCEGVAENNIEKGNSI